MASTRNFGRPIKTHLARVARIINKIEMASKRKRSLGEEHLYKKHDNIQRIILESVEKLGYDTLKPEQEAAISSFISNEDVFVCLPTGFGKSLCFYCLPLIYDKLYGRDDNSSMIIVVSPLTALMSDQVRLLTSKGMSSISLSGLNETDQNASDIKTNVANGYYQIVFTSPEQLLFDKEWKDVFESEHIRQHLVGIIIDEAHTVYKR